MMRTEDVIRCVDKAKVEATDVQSVIDSSSGNKQ